jgi:hypothetical protein
MAAQDNKGYENSASHQRSTTESLDRADFERLCLGSGVQCESLSGGPQRRDDLARIWSWTYFLVL